MDHFRGAMPIFVQLVRALGGNPVDHPGILADAALRLQALLNLREHVTNPDVSAVDPEEIDDLTKSCAKAMVDGLDLPEDDETLNEAIVLIAAGLADALGYGTSEEARHRAEL